MMVTDDRDTRDLIQESDRREVHRFHRSISMMSYEQSNISPKQLFDVLNQLYDDRTHRKCILASYLTLLSMILTIVSWMSYWLVYNRSENSRDAQVKISLHDIATLLETLNFCFLGSTPFLFLLMISLWIRYSCYNPMDSIREDGKLIHIENEQWRKQLNYFYEKKFFRLFNCFHSKQRRELDERGYGYVILSSHGIVIDELLLLSARRDIIDHAILSNHGHQLELTFKRTCSSPLRFHVSIYLSEDLSEREDFEELKQLLQIQNNEQSRC